MGNPDEQRRRYDTFVVRLWRDVVSRRLIRADVEHIQSGHRVERRWRSREGGDEGDGLVWIAEQIRASTTEVKGGREADES